MKTQGRVLLHICCAPDATVPWTELLKENEDVWGYFYGSNIHPKEEYDRRLNAVIQLSETLGAPLLVEQRYSPLSWLLSLRGHLYYPEGGVRCALCIRAQLDSAAQVAREGNFAYLGTTLTISPHKKPDLINAMGRAISRRYGLKWLDVVWRKNNGFLRSVEMSKRLGLYRQNYCGCILSFRGERHDKKQGAARAS